MLKFTLNPSTTMWAATVFIVVVGGLVLACASFVAMLLWNECLVPAVTSLNEISWIQSLGIMALVNVMARSVVTFTKD